MLQENEKALANYRPNFLEQIQKISIDEIEGNGDRVELTQARDGNSVLLMEREGQIHRLNSAFRPVQEADRWAAQYNFDHLENIALLFGMGNGIFARSILQFLKKSDKLVIYEPSLRIFQLVLEQEDICDIVSDSRVHIVVEGINVSDFYFILERHLDWRNIDALCVCEHPGYKELFAKSYQNFVNQVVECKELVYVVKHTDVHFAHQTVMNYFLNMRHILKANTIADFVGKIPERVPAIIVSAGPSLDKNIEELKRAEGKAFILVVDSAVKMLLNRGIKFDAMITVDAGKSVSNINREECKEIPLFCGLMSRPEIMIFNQGKKVLIMGSRYIDSLYAEMGHPFLPINIGGSVATAAFSTCEKLGFKKIILIGQDLAYDGESTHAGGMVKNIVNENVGQQEIDGWSGGKVRSRYDWIIYRNWFESAIQQLPEVQVIDATEGGALIHGSEVMTLSEVIDKYCTQTFSMRDLIEKEAPTFNAEAYLKVREKLLHLEKEMENVRRSSEDAVIVCDQVLNLIKQCGNNVSVHKQAKRLSALNDTIASQGVYQLLDYYVTDTAVEDLREINQMTGNKEQDLLNTYISAKAMYNSLIQAVDDLNGNGFEKEIEILQQSCEEAMVICKQILDLVKENGDNAFTDEQTNRMIALNETIVSQRIYPIVNYYVMNSLTENNQMAQDTEQDFMNACIELNKLFIKVLKDIKKYGFVHKCLEYV